MDAYVICHGGHFFLGRNIIVAVPQIVVLVADFITVAVRTVQNVTRPPVG